MLDIKLREGLINLFESLNIFHYGFTPCRKFFELKSYFESKVKNSHLTEFEEKDVEKRINPFLYFENGKTIISIAIPYLHNNENYKKDISKYTQGMDYHFVVSDYLNKVCNFIKEFGYNCKYFCDTNNLPERYIAYLSGVGHIGRNSLLYTKKYGSYVFLGEIITNVVLCEEKPNSYYEEKFREISEFRKCGKCYSCIKNCPNNVLIEKNFNKCVSNLTQQKHLNSEEMKNLNEMIFGCDVCQDSCPKNKVIDYAFDERFKIQEFLKDVDDKTIINMDNKYFKENFKKLSCSWRGKNLLKRNVMIKNRENLKFLEKLNFDNVDYLNNYKNTLLNNKNQR